MASTNLKEELETVIISTSRMWVIIKTLPVTIYHHNKCHGLELIKTYQTKDDNTYSSNAHGSVRVIDGFLHFNNATRSMGKTNLVCSNICLEFWQEPIVFVGSWELIFGQTLWYHDIHHTNFDWITTESISNKNYGMQKANDNNYNLLSPWCKNQQVTLSLQMLLSSSFSFQVLFCISISAVVHKSSFHIIRDLENC